MKLGLTFDDVLLVPNYSTISSRFSGEISLETSLFPRFDVPITLKYPIISANMDTVSGWQMVEKMNKLGGTGIIHRFMEPKDHATEITHLWTGHKILCIGVGAGGQIRLRRVLDENEIHAVMIDVAHGHCSEVLKQIQWVRNNYPDLHIIAGNVATPSGAEDLYTAGANCIKVGVGPGSLCTTRIQTGVGVPQLTAIMDIARRVREFGLNCTIIADGGIKSSGDIMKALVAGADAVMIGNLLAGTDETPGEVRRMRSGELYKIYRGMAGEDAQKEWKGYARSIEGETMRIAYKGPVENIFKDLVEGMLSCMSYIDAKNLKELRGKSTFIQQTAAGTRESHPHALK